MTSRDTRRTFTQTQKNEILQQQGGKCAICHEPFNFRIVQYHHIKGWAANGKTIIKNAAAVCPNCHSEITHNERLKKIDRPKTAHKLATKQSLERLTVTQLKALAKRHNIKVPSTVDKSAFFGTTYTKSPTKRQYINKLLGVVYKGEKIPQL